VIGNLEVVGNLRGGSVTERIAVLAQWAERFEATAERLTSEALAPAAHRGPPVPAMAAAGEGDAM
jgi:hypothetical protein